MSTYTTIDDVISLWRPLTPEECSRAVALIPVVEDTIRQYAMRQGKNIDTMITDGTVLLNVFKSVVVQVVGRTLTQDTQSEAMSQMSQSALGYSVSGTYLVPGGGVFVKRSEYALLGLRSQRIRAIEIYGSPVVWGE